MAKDSFVFLNAWESAIENFSDADAGAILKAIMRYNSTGKEPEDLPFAARIFFEMARPFFDASAEKYRERCDRNRENGVRGGRPKSETEETEKPTRFSDKTEKPTRFLSETQKTVRFSDKTEKPLYEYEYEYKNENDIDSPKGGKERARAREETPSCEKTVKNSEEGETVELDASDDMRNRYLPDNVDLSYSQTEELRKRYPAQWYDLIAHFSAYQRQSGKKYADHYAVILEWADRDGVEVGRSEKPAGFKVTKEQGETERAMAFRRAKLLLRRIGKGET